MAACKMMRTWKVTGENAPYYCAYSVKGDMSCPMTISPPVIPAIPLAPINEGCRNMVETNTPGITTLDEFMYLSGDEIDRDVSCGTKSASSTLSPGHLLGAIFIGCTLLLLPL